MEAQRERKKSKGPGDGSCVCVKESLWLLSGEQTWGQGKGGCRKTGLEAAGGVKRLDPRYIFKDKLMGFPNILDVAVRGKRKGLDDDKVDFIWKPFTMCSCGGCCYGPVKGERS